MSVSTLPAASWGRVLHTRLLSTARILQLGAVVLALAVSPSTYRAPWRGLLATQVVRAALPLLPWFTLLAALSSVVALVLAYLLAHGLSPWAFDGYTRLVGQVFSPPVSLVFVLKTGALALAVSVVPIGAALHGAVDDSSDGMAALGLDLQVLVRMFVVMLVVEVAALAGNYL